MARLIQHLLPFGIDLLRFCAWLAILAAIFVPLERIWPVRRQNLLRKGFAIDLAYYFLSAILPKLLLILPLSVLAALMRRVVGDGWSPWPHEIPFPLRLLLALIVSE